MPKLGMEPIRRAALIQATIAEIGAVGTLDVTVARIARTAGMSPALAHHYFGSKERIFLAAMRHVLAVYAGEVREALAGARGPRDRLDAVIGSQFTGANFRPAVIAAWLNFYVLARTQPKAARLLGIYQRRLASNLTHALRPLTDRPTEIARTTAALIDGLYIRHALAEAGPPDASTAIATVDRYLSLALGDRP